MLQYAQLPLGPESQTSAGGVLWRRQRGAIEICLISVSHANGNRWQLPKGHPSLGESDADAARREIREETGCDGVLDDPTLDDLGEITFWFFIGAGTRRRRVRKSVRFFLFRYVSGDTRDHDGEVDDARWLPMELVLRQLTFDSERAVLERALVRLRACAPPGGA